MYYLLYGSRSSNGACTVSFRFLLKVKQFGSIRHLKELMRKNHHHNLSSNNPVMHQSKVRVSVSNPTCLNEKLINDSL